MLLLWVMISVYEIIYLSFSSVWSPTTSSTNIICFTILKPILVSQSASIRISSPSSARKTASSWSCFK
jgi:hypothetical protein